MSFYIKKLQLFLKSKRGGIFDEAMLLGAKGIILVIILSGFIVSILSIITNFTDFLEKISNTIPQEP
ncbi:MAG: hypothetical protein HeimC2_17610 [Candidatus Heimdallarchaeota archaeon LC_2]|nr:MAG: hypothetical protein HeimC2_17610 [Candidatus Heimdallarchaeota archaeon LC_2]